VPWLAHQSSHPVLNEIETTNKRNQLSGGDGRGHIPGFPGDQVQVDDGRQVHRDALAASPEAPPWPATRARRKRRRVRARAGGFQLTEGARRGGRGMAATDEGGGSRRRRRERGVVRGGRRRGGAVTSLEVGKDQHGENGG
jgi:hypothetical protein